MQPWVYPSDVNVATALEGVDSNTCILSCNYRKEASWGNDAAVADITQNIRHVLQEVPCKRIVLAGGSMGACTALGYAVQAPPDIMAKVEGIMAFQGTGDLTALYRQTVFEPIRICMATAFGGTPDQVPDVYRAKSLIQNLDKLPERVRVAIVSTDQDNIVPSSLQFEVADKLLARHQPVMDLRVW
jgi:dienelactone hydrolase